MKNLALFVTSLVSVSAFSQTYSYPELEVRPRASTRLGMEAKNETKRSFSEHSHIAIPTAITLVASGLAMNDPGDFDEDNGEKADESPVIQDIGQAGVATSLGWLGLTYYLHKNYTPYNDGLKAINSLRAKTKSEILIRERIAEERLRAAAKTGRRIKWLSFATNGATNIAIASSAGNTETRAVATAGVLASAVSLLFDYVWNDVYCAHESYKKRIYGPVASTSFQYNEKTRLLEPTLALTLPL